MHPSIKKGIKTGLDIISLGNGPIMPNKNPAGKKL